MRNVKDKLPGIVREHAFFCVIMLFLAVYYMYRLFAVPPWYDETYTYINFIDRGVYYSMTHWPLPNNHVFFSMLSAPFRIFGVYPGLRAVSYLSALCALWMLYLFFGSLYSRMAACCACMLYAWFGMTNEYAVQGRGYSLSTACFCVALYCAYRLLSGALPAKKIRWTRFHTGFMLSMFFGLYTLVSSLYWVLPLCVCAGLCALVTSGIRRLPDLILPALCAAFLTVCVYVFLWCHMGAQSVQQETGLTENIYATIFSYPRTCLTRGFLQMKNDPNMQSVDPSAFVSDFRYFFRDVFAGFIPVRSNESYLVFRVVVLLFCIPPLLYGFYIFRKKERSAYAGKLLVMLLAGPGFVFLYVILRIQSAYPFSRVFAFLGVLFVMMAAVIVQGTGSVMSRIVRRREGGKETSAAKERPLRMLRLAAGTVLFACLAFSLITREQVPFYARDDAYALDAIRHTVTQDTKTFLANEVYMHQQMVFQISLGEKRELLRTPDHPDVLLLKKAENTGGWPFLITPAEQEALLEKAGALLYENEGYAVYGAAD